MTNKKISALTSATTPLAGTETLPIVQSGATVKVSVDDLTTGKTVNAANFVSTGLIAAGTDFKVTSNAGYGIKSQDGTRIIEIYNSATYQYVDQLLIGANLRIATAAKGINFTGNTPAAGMTTQLLNWYEEGTWTPNQGGGLTVIGAFSSTGKYTRVGCNLTISGTVTGATSVALVAAGIITTNLPFTVGTAGHGNVTNAALTSFAAIICTSTNVTSAGAIASTGTLTFSATYFV